MTTDDGFRVAIDVTQTVRNVKQVGVKKLAKRIAKETGKSYGQEAVFSIFSSFTFLVKEKFGGHSDSEEEEQETLLIEDSKPTLMLENNQK